MRGISASAHKHLLIHWLLPYPVAAFCLCNTLLLPIQLIITQAPSLRDSWCSFLWPICVPHQESQGNCVTALFTFLWWLCGVCPRSAFCEMSALTLGWTLEGNFEVAALDFFSDSHTSHPLCPHRLPLSLLSRSSCPVSCLFPLVGPLSRWQASPHQAW